MAYVVMASVVYDLCGYGLYTYGLYTYGLYGYGIRAWFQDVDEAMIDGQSVRNLCVDMCADLRIDICIAGSGHRPLP